MAVSAKKMTPVTAPETQTESAEVKTVSTGTTSRSVGRPKLSVIATKTAAPAKTDPKALWAMSALESSRACLFLCDKDFTIVHANGKSLEILSMMEPNLRKLEAWKHFRAEDVVGMNLDFLFVDEPFEFRRAADPRNHPYRNSIKTGPCVCDVQITGIRDEKGEVTAYAVDWERITDKLAQESRTKQLMTVLENAQTNTFLCDMEWNITYANKRSFEVLAFMEPNLHRHSAKWQSFRANDILGKPLHWLFTDEPEEISRATSTQNHPYHKVIKTGPCVCELFITGTYDDAGKQIGYAVSWERITERVAAEKRNTQLQMALENASSSVMVTDTELNILYLNKSLKQKLKAWEPELQKIYGSGFRYEELLGRCIDDFHKDPRHQRKLLANESIFPFETRINIGSYLVDLSVNILKSEQGETLGFCTEWVDVTERIRSEEEYKTNVKEIADRMEFLRGACATDLSDAMEALAAGDLTVEITPRTPLLDIPPQTDLALMAQTFNDLRNQTVKSVEAYNRAKAALSALIGQTRVTAESIYQVSTEVAAGNDDLSQRTEEQASSLEETASSMEEMTSTVKQNADNARQANQLATQAREVAEKGGAVVSNAVTSMEEINKASKRIADIISVIDEIAFQTNLLALNAAVEAARVGEQGRGFAVVAAEVRSLAGRSATAAKEIKALVQDSVQKVQEGSSLVNQSGQQLQEIVTSVKKVADIIAEISAASQEQSAGIEQVNKAIIQMDQITQQNAALVEEASSAAQSMNQQASDLQSLVSRFQLDDNAMAEIQQKSAVSHTAPARPKSGKTVPAAKPMRPPVKSHRSFTATNHDDDSGFEEF